MSQPKKRIVLFLPLRADPRTGVRVSADLLPLELLQISGLPDRDGYEIEIVDAMVCDDYLDRLMELCDGALLFGSSCIRGFQVAHGSRVAKALRERYPDLPMIWGGWFPSVLPERFLEEGIADAVCLGQGEFTFSEVVAALESGTDLAEVPGLMVRRDGENIRTEHRKVVGFDDIPDVPWHLIDYEQYAELQRRLANERAVRHRYADPWDLPAGTVRRGFSFHSSYGCPEPCTFCCSPDVTGRRWKAIPGHVLAERILECHDRFEFNVLRFQDANFGVHERRSNEFCQDLIDAGSPFWWSGTYEIETVARYAEESIDRMAESRFHLATLGAESGSEEQLSQIKKKIDIENHLELALNRLNRRGIQTALSWIIGYPGESAKSMHETITVAARIKHRFPNSPSDVFPFWAIPGTEDFRKAVESGYVPPTTLEEWGAMYEYKVDLPTGIPEDVVRRWKRYCTTSSFYDGVAREGSNTMRRLMRRISGWRLGANNFSFPIEHKLFHAWVRLTGQRTRSEIRTPKAAKKGA